ncbi:hypothetical protein SAICODRAFT_29455, partial [Saitoella complicata NRRL Y-17804]|uniref:uncharacterized protein n=1 Tax=Saitoella complicata (strain BCRC 22490 / CBS 7301 / JCM 7358 / NBRC 10748 / NRRL Y-17804) TaxID=698492 RepID=UPI0008672306
MSRFAVSTASGEVQSFLPNPELWDLSGVDTVIANIGQICGRIVVGLVGTVLWMM